MKQQHLLFCLIVSASDGTGKIRQAENEITLHSVRLAEMDLRIQCLESASYDGRLMWKISEYKKRKADAVSNKVASIYSQPFYSSRFGYKMCARVYLNGDGMGKNTHLSLFFVVMRGEYDQLLTWPFKQKVGIIFYTFTHTCILHACFYYINFFN